MSERPSVALCLSRVWRMQLKGQTVNNENKTDPRRAVFRAYLAAEELVKIAASEKREAPRLLDVGGAYGIHARFFRKELPSLRIEMLDTVPADEPLEFTGRYDHYTPSEKYDYIWASHVLEHVPDPGSFFAKLHSDLKDGGWAAITVPPLKHDMTFAHLTLWNAGLLLIHFISQGFDCSNAHVATYGYNVTVIAQKNSRKGKTKEQSLPTSVKRKGHYFEGDIKRANWLSKSPRLVAPLGFLANEKDTIQAAEEKGIAGFLASLDKEGNQAILYYDAVKKEAYRAG